MTKIRYYRNLFEGIIQALYQIHTKNNYADQVVAKLLKSNKKWGSKDRKFVAEVVYDITRYRRLFYEIAEVNAEQATTNELWKVIAVWCVKNKHEFPTWDEFSGFDYATISEQIDKAKTNFVLWESIPDWLHDLGEAELEKELWQTEVKSLNEEAQVVLRVNTLALNNQSDAIQFVQNSIHSQGIPTKLIENYPFALQLEQRQNIQHTSAYNQGRVEIQDANSQLVAPFTKVQPGMKVIDACAGGGGKSLHLAALMQNQGEILAFDVVDWKLNELEQRAKRANANIIKTALPDEKQLLLLQNTADVVVIDAPCSGLGTLRRKADLKWKLSEDFIHKMIQTQQEVLLSYAPLVKSGGCLVYATCSFLPSENKEQINWFLQTKVGKQFKLQEEEQLYSHSSGFDSFYMARLQKIGN